MEGQPASKSVRYEIRLINSPLTECLQAIFHQKIHVFSKFLAISMFAYAGAMIRVGFQYYKIWKIETNYCVLYPNIIGSFIMGFVVANKDQFFNSTNDKVTRALYVAITSGFCGSLTTFSSWAIESNKNFFLQMDLSYGNHFGSYNGGRFFEWLTSMIIGAVVPLATLRFGKYLASTSANTNESEIPPGQNGCATVLNYINDYSVIILSLISTALVIGIPIAVDQTWIFIVYTCIFGAIGAITRYFLSKLNSRNPKFPIGTFACNVIGTLLMATFILLSKFAVDYYDVSTQALLFGLVNGFCGCLTTISSFVNELDTLAPRDAYIYGISTSFISQFGIMVIYNAYAYSSVPPAVVMPPPIDLCYTNYVLCDSILTKLGCDSTNTDYMNVACTTPGDYTTFIGKCGCGKFQTERIIEAVIDSQTRHNITNSMVSAWPRNPNQVDDPMEVFDYCLTYENSCDHYLNRIGCANELRTINGCSRRGIDQVASQCVCGSHDASKRVQELITDVALARRYDLYNFTGYGTLTTVDYGSIFENVCSKMLEHVNCPVALKTNIGCEITRNYATWVGQCGCGSNYDLSLIIAEDTYDSLLKNYLYSLLHKPDPAVQVWDMCYSFHSICSLFLDTIACPSALRSVIPCGNVDTNSTSFNGTYPYGQLVNFTSVCHCGNLQYLSDRSYESVIDALSLEQINTQYIYIPPPMSPYTAVINTNPFLQLL